MSKDTDEFSDGRVHFVTASGEVGVRTFPGAPFYVAVGMSGLPTDTIAVWNTHIQTKVGTGVVAWLKKIGEEES